jgi:hypothetical protein
METHLTAEEIDRMLHKTMRAEEFIGAARHIERCRECRDRLSAALPEPVFAIGSGEPPHVDLDQLQVYRSGGLDAADREIVESHLQDCLTCREDLDDIALEPDVPRRISWVAAAAVIAVVGGGFYLVSLRKAEPRPAVTVAQSAKRLPGPRYERAEWNDLVAKVMRDRALPHRELSDVRPGPDPLRGARKPSIGALEPQGIVVETTRPQLRWPTVAGAKSTVLLQPGGTIDVLRSPALTTAEWTPDFDLVRGTVYEWQVSVETARETLILPAPPAPRALFRVLEAEKAATIAAARRDHPQDHLLLASLYADAGLEAEALRELDLLRADPARTQLANALIEAFKQRQ